MKQAPDLPIFLKGKQVLSKLLNQVVQLIPTFITGGPGITITKFGNKIVISLASLGALEAGLGKSFRVKSVEVDFLICREWDGKTEGTVDVKVALPPLNRRTPFDGTTGRDGFTYVYSSNTARVSTKTEDTTTENQEIIPKYVVNDVIIGLKLIAGSSTVFQALAGGVPIDPIPWLDLNVDNRVWKEVST